MNEESVRVYLVRCVVDRTTMTTLYVCNFVDVAWCVEIKMNEKGNGDD